jgi:hypothetical protein
MAQANRAVTPRDVGGPWGKRASVTVGGSLNWALRVSAFVTGRASSSDWPRYSLVVLNWLVLQWFRFFSTEPFSLRDDSSTTTWNPQPVQATIEFRGKQVSHLSQIRGDRSDSMKATFTFQVGVTTLWWYAAANSLVEDIKFGYEGEQQPLGL